MTSRERVLTALDHCEPDRVPIDLGGSVVTSIGVPTYAGLRRALGLPERPIGVLEEVQQIAVVDGDVMAALGVDVLPVFANAVPANGPTVVEERDGSRWRKDDYGATLRMPPGGSYFDYTEFPLAEPSIEALDAMPWPDPALPARYKGLRERTAALRASTDKALLGMAPGGHDLFNRLLRVRGMDEGLMDLVANRDFAEAFLDRMTDSICTAQRCFLREVGDLIDVHFNGDDLSGQHGPLIAPKTYRELIKPRQMRIMETVKGCTNARIFYHSCGAVGEFIPDILEMGVDILNPVQVSAAGMNTADLKRRYGREISFWGGGCDTQFVLSTGTADEVRNEVRRRIRDLAPGGGYIFNPVHNIQPLVPPENVVAMFDEARTSGQYPLKR